MILRLHYRKNGYMKFVSHLDMVKTLERTFRRVRLPIKFSQGFNPHPKMAFAAPLSVGVSSDYEIIDVELTTGFEIKHFIKDQKDYLPEGIEIVRAKFVDQSRSLMSMVAASSYLVRVKTSEEVPFQTIEASLEGFLANESITYTKVKGEGRKQTVQEVDIRPHIHSLIAIDSDEDDILLKMKISAGSVFNLKPDTVLECFKNRFELPIIMEDTRIHRLMLYGEKNGELVEMYDMV